MTAPTWTHAPGEPAERVFAATADQLRDAARAVVDDEPIVAAGAFWPDGVTAETIERGTVGGHRMGLVFGPTLGAFTALAGAFSGRGPSPEAFDLAKPLIVAVTAARILVVEPPTADEPARVARSFDRPATQVTVKRRGFTCIVILDDEAAGKQFRLIATTAPHSRRRGPQRAVLAELTAAA